MKLMKKKEMFKKQTCFLVRFQYFVTQDNCFAFQFAHSLIRELFQNWHAAHEIMVLIT